MNDRANVKILPPIVVGAALALGMAIAGLFPTPLLPSNVAIAVGTGFIVLSLPLVLLAARQLNRASTAFDVRKPTTTVVTTGIFRVSRNPVYLSMMLLYVGIAFLMNSPWMLLVAYPTGSALCLLAIRPEERYLATKFGDAYQNYTASVPRWIGRRSFTWR
jgi:protein-S-isoprenylcysteine O-methyltransferase Ste14